MEGKQHHLRAKKLVQIATIASLLIVFYFLCASAKSAHAISCSASISLKTTVPTSIASSTPQIIPTATPAVSVNTASETPSSAWDAPTVISLVGVIVQALAFIAVIKYVRDTAKMASATEEAADATKKSAQAAENTVQEMKTAREEENAPFVVVYFNHYMKFHTLYLVVDNIGKKIATDIKLEFTPPLQVTEFNKERIATNSLLNNGIKSLVPNYKISIPFDFLIPYLKANLPLQYQVKVTYIGNSSLPPITLEYTLDLSHYKYIDFQTEPGLGQIIDALDRLESHFSQYSSSTDTANNLLNHIANAINGGVTIKNRISVSLSSTNIPEMLKEFVFLWVVDYGKKREKWNKTFIFGLRAKCLLLSEELLKSTTTLDTPAWMEQLKQVISNLSLLGSIQTKLDLPDGSFSSVPIFLSVGTSKEDFDKLGESIVADIRTITELIEKEQDAPLKNDNLEEAQPLTDIEETNKPDN